MTRTYLSVSEKIDYKYHRSIYILHNGWQWYHADTNSKNHMEDLLEFFECEVLDVDSKAKMGEAGMVTYYNLSKDIVNYERGFWKIADVVEYAESRRIKSFLGLSNGSIVTCYAIFDDDNRVEIMRPNPNAKDVYNKMPHEAEMEFRKNHWYI